MNTCVVRPFGTAQANAMVPRTLGSLNGSSGMVFGRHACATFGSPLMPNCAQVFARMRKIAALS
jgi:hypothetical protein